MNNSQANTLRKQLLGFMIPQHDQSKDYGIIIKMESRAKADLGSNYTSPFMNRGKINQTNTLGQKKLTTNVEFKPNRLQARKYCTNKTSEKVCVNESNDKRSNLETTNTKNDLVKIGLTKIRNLALQLKELRTKDSISRSKKRLGQSNMKRYKHKKNKTMDELIHNEKDNSIKNTYCNILSASFIEPIKNCLHGIILYYK